MARSCRCKEQKARAAWWARRLATPPCCAGCLRARRALPPKAHLFAGQDTFCSPPSSPCATAWASQSGAGAGDSFHQFGPQAGVGVGGGVSSRSQSPNRSGPLNLAPRHGASSGPGSALPPALTTPPPRWEWQAADPLPDPPELKAPDRQLGHPSDPRAGFHREPEKNERERVSLDKKEACAGGNPVGPGEREERDKEKGSSTFSALPSARRHVPQPIITRSQLRRVRSAQVNSIELTLRRQCSLFLYVLVRFVDPTPCYPSLFVVF